MKMELNDRLRGLAILYLAHKTKYGRNGKTFRCHCKEGVLIVKLIDESMALIQLVPERAPALKCYAFRRLQF